MLYGSAAAMIVGRTKTLAMLYGFAAAMITSTQAFDPRLSTQKFNILLDERFSTGGVRKLWLCFMDLLQL